jgi:hypothetical protein
MVSDDLILAAGDLLWQAHLVELLEQLPCQRATMVVHLEGLELPLERRVVSECTIEVWPARIPPGPAQIADDLVGDGIHGIGHALHSLQPKSHYRWGGLPRPLPEVASAQLRHSLSEVSRSGLA